jgi:hypothetical protein
VVKKLLFLAILCAGTIGLSLCLPYGSGTHTTEGASTTAELSGYAWSSNIGWISFKGSNYGVTFDQLNGTLSGYAWSSNIGWISFNTGDLTGCPTNPCRASYSNNAFSGWAKALSADGKGWDGWIHISGSGYGLTLSDTTISGYMWGGPVIGWIRAKTLITTPLADTCSNGIDDDNDGLVDEADVDCGLINPPTGVDTPGTETNKNPQCNNGVDDDGDGVKDYPADEDCTGITDTTETSTPAPEVTLKVGIGSPSFDTINLSKTGGSVLLGIDIKNASSTTSCTGSAAGATTNTPLTINTGGVSSYYTQQSLTVSERTRVSVSCQTAGKTGSDSVDIIIKSENEF